MLYLEDFLELIEQLPSELRDRFTEMREMDLQVQNSCDKNEEGVKMFFRNALQLSPDERKRQAEKIRQEFKVMLETADEKVNLANSMHDLVERFLRKLDFELGKFKAELEADNPGITEVLEKKAFEAEEARSTSAVNSKRPNRKRGRGDGLLESADGESVLTVQQQVVNQVRGAGVVPPPPANPQLLGSPSLQFQSSPVPLSITPRISVTSATTLQNRRNNMAQRTPEIRTLNVNGQQITMRSERTPSQSNFMHAFQQPESRMGRPRKLTTKLGEMIKQEAQRHENRDYSSSMHPGRAGSPEEDASDPNEPRYCICNQVSYGEMVACDNKDCPFEWFHYACVGITQPPKGKWYCPQCTAAMRRRASRLMQ